MTRVIHITADYPDAYSTRKTHAVLNLVEGTPALSHRIYSINRRNGLGGIHLVDQSGDLTTLIYRAPPYGVLLETFLDPLADWIVNDCHRQGGAIDIVHAHKLTIEGLIARRVARALGCPYICTAWGNTDQKYLRFKPEKHSTYRDVAENAAMLLPVTPWIERDLTLRLSLKHAPRMLLPSITQSDRFLTPSRQHHGFVTVFRLDYWRQKGMQNLFSAIAELKERQLDVSLDIIGGGSRRAMVALRREIGNRRIEDRVSLRGPVAHEQIQETINGYAALVLPSLRETFGMVYIEALFSGVPILYSKDIGVDGFFDDQAIGVRCDPRSVTSIARGLIELRSSSERMKQTILDVQKNGGFERFRKAAVCRHYSNAIDKLQRLTPKLS